jgi:hypothetical protein
VLADVLRSAISELREEVYKSETTDYKESLRQREKVLDGLLARLGSPSTSRVSG